MTYSPQTISDLARFWIGQGGANSGIVGDAAHAIRPSYHNGKDRIVLYERLATDYTCRQPRDRAGLSDAASAIDLGRLDGSLAKLQDFSRWLAWQCSNGAPGTADIREVIYSPDGKTIRRWDHVSKSFYTGGDGTGHGDHTHLWHTHISFYRDSEARAKVPLFAPYFAQEVDDMPQLVFFEIPRLAILKAEAILYEDPALTKIAYQKLDTKNPDGTPREWLYPGSSGSVAMIGYEPLSGDTDSSSVGYFCKRDHIASSRPMPSGTVTAAQLKAAKEEGAKEGYNEGLNSIDTLITSLPRRT